MGVHRQVGRRARRRALGAVAIVSLASLVVGVDARAQEDDPPDPSEFSVEGGVTSAGRITGDKAPSSALAETDRALLRRNDSQPVQVAIKLDYDAVAVYAGGVEGFEATSPMVTGVPLSERPAAARRYEGHIASQEAAFVAALRADGAERPDRHAAAHRVRRHRRHDPGQRGRDRARHPGGGRRPEERPAPTTDRLEPRVRQRRRRLRRAGHDRECRRRSRSSATSTPASGRSTRRSPTWATCRRRVVRPASATSVTTR